MELTARGGRMKQFDVRKLVYLAFFVSLATALHVIETLIPSLSFIVPGAKLGLANLVTLVTIILYDRRSAFLVALLRVCLGSLVAGTFLTTTFFLSFTGAILSSLAMGYLFKIGSQKFSPMGISIAGSVVHNISQLFVAALIIDNLGIFFYLPYLLLFSLPTGYFTGIIAFLLVKYLKSLNFVSAD